MRSILVLAGKEVRDGLRNRWVSATIVLLATLAASLAFLGAAPGGTVKASTLAVTVVSLSSLTVYLMPLIALMLAYDAVVGEVERGTVLLLLTYPVARWQAIAGKALGHTAILALAVLVGYGGVGAAIAVLDGADGDGLVAYGLMMASSIVLGMAFLGLGYLISVLARERAMAAGLAVALWLLLVVVYDLGLIGVLAMDSQQVVSTELFSALMLVNPADAYRLFNLASIDAVSRAAGLGGLGPGAAPATAATLGALAAWVALPFAATTLIFQRREL